MSKNNNEVTTVGHIKCIDITHRPKRIQGENFPVAEQDEEKMSSNSNIPSVVTVERAIHYFNSNAEGEKAKLYHATSKWLQEYLTLKSPKPKNMDKIKEEAGE